MKAMKEEIHKLEMQQNMGLSDNDVEKITRETINDFVEKERLNEIERRNEIELELQNELERQSKLELERQNELKRQSELELERQNELKRQSELQLERQNPYKLETIHETDSDDEVEIIKVVPGTIEVKVKEESINDLISGGLIFDADIEPENIVLTSDNDLDLFSAEELAKELENGTGTEKIESEKIESEKIESEKIESEKIESQTIESETIESETIEVEPIKKRRGRPKKSTS